MASLEIKTVVVGIAVGDGLAFNDEMLRQSENLTSITDKTDDGPVLVERWRSAGWRA